MTDPAQHLDPTMRPATPTDGDHIANIRYRHALAAAKEREAAAARAAYRDAIRDARSMGLTTAEIGRALNVSRQYINRISKEGN